MKNIMVQKTFGPLKVAVIHSKPKLRGMCQTVELPLTKFFFRIFMIIASAGEPSINVSLQLWRFFFLHFIIITEH